MRYLERSITKEQYDRAQLNRGYITEEDELDIFDEAERYGYGVYGAVAREKTDDEGNTAYYVLFSMGSSCD